MDREEAQATLDKLRVGLHQQFDSADDLHGNRLAQLDAGLATVSMVVEHLYDEEVRHRHEPRAHQRAIGAYVREDW